VRARQRSAATILGVLPLLACALAPAPRPGPARVEVAWSLCRITTTPEGHDLDDGPLVVDLVARGATPERVAVGRVSGSCWPSGPGTPPPLVCRDPHVARRTSISARRAGHGLIVERRDQATDADGRDTVPQAPFVQVAALTVPPDAELVYGASPACPD
jgi:hypothetical protein